MGNTVEEWRASIGGWTRGSLTPDNKCRGSSTSSPWFQLLVLVALLVIGGIEMNPGPNQSETPTFEKTGGFADMAGENYEWKMSALLFLRALQTGHQYQLASNMKAAGKFDDVVLTHRDCTMFLQLKHKKNPETVLKLRDLTRDKNFQLSKYLDSYLEIKQRWQEDSDLQRCGSFNDAKFVIYTNARVDEGLVNIAGSAELLDIVSTGGTCVCLTELFESLPKYKAALSAAVSSENVTATPELWEVVHKLYNKQARALPKKKQLQEMLEHLESLGDLTQYQQFISQLYFCTGQAAEKDLDDLIAQNILNVCGTDSVLRDFKDGMQNWWGSSNCYLTARVDFFQKIIQKIAASISKDRPPVNVRFLENEFEPIRKMFSQENRMLYIHTHCTNLSVEKVLQSFQKNLLVDVSTLQIRVSEVLAVWRLGMCDVLVVEGHTTDTNILNKLGSMPDPKCVVVISDKAEHTELYQQFKFVSFTDTFCLSQLDWDSQCDVLEHEVMFQGFPVKLNSLAELSFLQTAVTADVVVQLHHTLQIGHRLDDLDPCYLPRTFLRKEFVSEQIFREHITLAVSGISEDRLAQLVPNGEEVKKHKTRKCFRIEGETDFTALCGNNGNIHWIEAREGRFLWIKSKGDISPIINHLEEEHACYAGSEKVFSLCHQVVLVVAEPGMGKSTEMCKVAQMIKQKEPSTWVVKVDLNKHTILLSQNMVDAVEFLENVAILNTEFQKHLFEHQLQSNGNVVILVDGVDEVSPNYSHQVIRLLKEFSVLKVRKIFVTSRPVILEELQQNLSTLAFSLHQFTPDDQNNFLTRFWNQLSINSSQLSHFISLLLQLVESSLNDNLKEFTGIPLQCKMLAEVYKDAASHFCQTGEVSLPQTLDILDLYDKFVDKKWEVYCMKMNIDMNTAFSLISSHKMMFQHSLMCCALVSYLLEIDITKLHSKDHVLQENQNFVSTFSLGQDKTGIVTHISNNKAVFVHRTFTEYFVAMWFSQHFDTESIIIRTILYIDKNFEIVRKFLDRILAKGLKLHTFVVNENLTEVNNLLSMQNLDVNEKDKGGRTVLHLAIMNYFHREKGVNDSMVQTLLEHGADVNCEDKVLHWSPLRLAEEIRAWSVVDKLLEKQADSKDLIWIRTNIEKQNPLQVSRNQHFVQSGSSGSEYETSSSEYEICGFESGGWDSQSESCRSESESCCSEYESCCSEYQSCGSEYESCGSEYESCCSEYESCGSEYESCGSEYESCGSEYESCGFESGSCGFESGSCGSECESCRSEYESCGSESETCGSESESCGSEGKLSVQYRMSESLERVMYTALCEGYLNLVEFILKCGVSVADYFTAGYGNQTTMLHIAAEHGQLRLVELLVQQGADVEISGGVYNTTPLMWAAESSNVEVVQLLITNGASVNARDKYGDTALLLTFGTKGSHEIIKLLLQNGADTEISGDECNRTPLMCAAVRGDAEVVQLLISHGASVNARDKYGHTALSLAAFERNNETVKILLEKGADVEISSGEYNRTPLNCAAERGDEEVVQLLIAHGACVTARDKYGYTALLLAASKGNNEIVKLLLQKGADVDISGGECNRTPLMWAAARGDVEIVQLLITREAPINTRDLLGYTALSLAAREGNNEIVKLLLKHTTYNTNDITAVIWQAGRGDVEAIEYLIDNKIINSEDKQGYTALLVATELGKNEIVNLLLQIGADVEISGGDYNRTPLMCAAVRGNMPVVQLLIGHGASVDTRNKYGDTALSLAAYEGNSQIVNLLLKHTTYNTNDIAAVISQAGRGDMKAIQYLIDNNIINSQDNQGYTALSVATKLRNNEIVKILLEKRADVEISDGEYNRTPLMWAVERGDEEVVQLLIAHGASVNARDKYGYTVLLLAVSKGNNEIVKSLLGKGADVEISDGVYNRTPLMCAAVRGDEEVAQLLITHGACVNTRNKRGRTALSLAASNNFKKILLEHGAHE